MTTDLEYIAALTEQLTAGFDERIEYALTIRTHTDDCRHDRAPWAECGCPETTEKRVKTVRHAPLIAQLSAAVSAPVSAPDTMGRSATRVESAAPCNIDALDLLDEMRRTIGTYVRRARQILGYDVPPSSIVRGAFCGECAGALKLHNGKAVCIGRIGESPPCGTEYTWDQIEDYLRSIE
jgi:hypothetical protein